jgi:Spherulation-specific family 4
MTPGPQPTWSRTILPLFVPPVTDPAVWDAVAATGGDLTVVVRPDGHDADGGAVLARLALSGVPVLGYVDLGWAARPVADLLDDVTRWVDEPVAGVFLDHAPTSPFSVGPVALAIRVARRAGLESVVLNPGVPTDPLYRTLPATVCTFEGSWLEYQRWSGEGSEPGDVHLVHSVPADRHAAARELLDRRGAAAGLVTDRTPPSPYGGAPAWLSSLPVPH